MQHENALFSLKNASINKSRRFCQISKSTENPNKRPETLIYATHTHDRVGAGRSLKVSL